MRKKYLDFNSYQLSVIVGSLLGDGCLSSLRGDNSNSYFSKSQAIRRKEYIDWHVNVFSKFTSGTKIYENSVNNKKFLKACFSTKTHPLLTKLRKKWYPNGIKIVPKDIKLDELSFAIWFLDDGSNYLKSRNIKLATYGFLKKDVEFLCKIIKRDLGFKCHRTKSNIIILLAESYFDAIKIIKKYNSFSCFSYKTEARVHERRIISKKMKKEIKNLYLKGTPAKVIAEKYNIDPHYVYVNFRKFKKNPNINTNNTTGYRNIYYDKFSKNWRVIIENNGKKHDLGRHKDIKDALNVLNAWKKTNNCF